MPTHESTPRHDRIIHRPLLRPLGAVALGTGLFLAGYHFAQDQEQEVVAATPHPVELHAVYGTAFDEELENIIGYVDSPFDVTCAYRSPLEHEGPFTDRTAMSYHVSGVNPQGDNVVGFIPADSGIRVSGTINDC